MAPDGADIEQDRFLLVARARKRGVAPGHPVDGLMSGGFEIGGGFRRQKVKHSRSRDCVREDDETAHPAHGGDKDEQPVPTDPAVAGGIVADRIRAPPPPEEPAALGLVPRRLEEWPGALHTVHRSAYQHAGDYEPRGGAKRVRNRRRAEPEEGRE